MQAAAIIGTSLCNDSRIK